MCRVRLISKAKKCMIISQITKMIGMIASQMHLQGEERILFRVMSLNTIKNKSLKLLWSIVNFIMMGRRNRVKNLWGSWVIFHQTSSRIRQRSHLLMRKLIKLCRKLLELSLEIFFKCPLLIWSNKIHQEIIQVSLKRNMRLMLKIKMKALTYHFKLKMKSVKKKFMYNRH